MKIIIVIATFLLASSCLNTRTKRPTEKESTPFILGDGDTNYSNPVNEPTAVASPTTTDPTSAIPEELKHCKWSTDGSTGYQSTSSHISNFTLCQVDETSIYIQLKENQDTKQNQICLIPTTNIETKITYVGEPRCFSASSSTQIYKLSMIKNRKNYYNYKITGIMMMIDKARHFDSPFYQTILPPDAYMFCSNWLEQTGDSSYCVAFDAAGAYVYHKF